MEEYKLICMLLEANIRLQIEVEKQKQFNFKLMNMLIGE